METWDHCVALLQAGASPTETLPSIRALFEQIHSSSSNVDGGITENNHALQTNTHERHSPVYESQLPSSTLLFRLAEGLPPFPVGYAEVPFHAWAALRETNDIFPLRSSTFDSEPFFDDLSAFQFDFVTSSKRESLKHLLQTESTWRPHLQSLAATAGGPTSVMDGDSLSPQYHPEEQMQLDLISKRLVDYIQSIGQTCSPLTCPSFPSICAEDWTLILDFAQEKKCLNPEVIEHLLRAILQPSLALVILQTWVPIFKQGIKSDHFIRLVDMAADAADLSQLSPAEINELLDIYRGLDDDAFSAISQLSIIKRVKTFQI